MELYNRNIPKEVSTKELSSSKLTFLKQTYELFAASLLAGATGAYLGMQVAPTIAKWYWGLVILEIAVLIGLYFTKKKPFVNLVMLFLFTFLTGLTLTPLLSSILSLPSGASIITNAFLLTGVAFGGISLFAFNTKRDFTFMGKFLFIALIVFVVAGLINIFVGSPLLQLILASVGALLFSAFILYDTQNLIQGNFDSPVEGAISLYLDVLNLFVSLLQILGFIDNE